ncbi:hypothetical protein [Streptomyces thermolineatus]|uniref:hypothetical protein n=1 Tax=Streptomyces thermolineatus TaxID=44033 RepID=UPI00384ACDC6
MTEKPLQPLALFPSLPSATAPSATAPSAAESSAAESSADASRNGPPGDRPRSRRALRLLCLTEMVAVVPYLALKVHWVTGGTTGLGDGALADAPAFFWLNMLTVGLAVGALGVGVFLAGARSLRAPAWPLLLPTWVGTGLLVPVVLAAPVAGLVLLLGADGGGEAQAAGSGQAPLVQPWVFGVVYTGFTVQGLALVAALALWVRARWGGALTEPVGSRASAPGPGAVARTVAAAASATVLAAAVLHGLWAAGAEVPLFERDALPLGVGVRLTEGVHVIAAVCAALGLWALLRPAGRRVRTGTVMTAVWIGTGVLFTGAGWTLLTSVVGPGGTGDVLRAPTPVELLWAVQMAAAVLIAAVAVRAFAVTAGGRSPAGAARAGG